MKHLRLFNTILFSAPLILTSLHAQKASDPELLRLGNGIAPSPKDKSSRPKSYAANLTNHPSTRVEARNAQEFSKRIDELGKEVLQNMLTASSL